ncbi:MAG: DEAD/DEAH box helicase [Clostridium sp.]|uniref:DEAD/DEAH box helicase n=1 Tax=Clostridium sp. TaxID=1506 RepID=UPI003D6CBFA0
MSQARNTTLGEIIYKDIDSNEYLNELYENILLNYSLKLFKQNRNLDNALNVEDALRFADLLSKSVDKQNSDKHKIWAQEIVALLNYIYPDNKTIEYYMGSVLSNTGNFRGMTKMTPEYKSNTLMDRLYSNFNMDYMSIPADPELQFFRSQREVYNHLTDQCFSYSGPTSMGKSFVMRMFIKQQILNRASLNFALLVPTKALINEVTSKILNDLKELLSEHNYRIVTSAGALALKQKHNFIFVLTPERLLYLLISNPNLRINHLFVDEAHKISAKDSRSAFYYKVVDMLAQQENRPIMIFASPNIPNPEVYLKLIPNASESMNNKMVSTFSPVSQVKFFIDFVDKNIQFYNTYKRSFSNITKLNDKATFCDVIRFVEANSQNIVYCSSTGHAVELALEYAKAKPIQTNNDLLTLAKDIKNEVHGDYYLADIISKGVAYHIGYLPSAIRMRIEDLFRQGLIKTMFCTSTLVEGVNLPADNLFITSYKIGLTKMTPVDFKNLVGRVGRIEYNLYGNVYLVRLAKNIKKEEFVKLLTQDVPVQKLSLVSELTNGQKKSIVDSLLKGNIELIKHPKNQSADSYALMRKFAIILLRDIITDKDSLVRKEFAPILNEKDMQKIKTIFNKNGNKPDDDINVSVDQTNNLTAAIAKGLKYPSLNENGNLDYHALVDFLETLCHIFKWEQYEPKTIGKKSQTGTHAMLKWYAVILSQWIQGMGLSHIMNQAINYKCEHPESKIKIKGEYVTYINSLYHRNIVISDTLNVIQNVILFSISNYFLRFSSEYKRFQQVETIPNDWYEYVEYGTTNPLTIMLQRSGFSRETATYIKHHKAEYVVMLPNNEVKLRRTLLDCNSISVRNETTDIQYNIPELFILF